MAIEPIDLRGRQHMELLVIAERACATLCRIANNLTTDEGDTEETEEEFGLDIDEVVGMAHDRIIADARAILDSIMREFPNKLAEHPDSTINTFA